MALGEQLGHRRGQITGMRVLPPEHGLSPRVEMSFQTSGFLLTEDVTDMGTYVSVEAPGGVLHGRGQGMSLTADGQTVTWTGQSVGRLTGRGSATSWRGAVFFHTTAPRLDRLNGLTGVFEYEVDESGKTEERVFEWR